MNTLFVRAAEALDRARTGDGFGPMPGAEPEPEPTALAALALDDKRARGWLARSQRDDGSFGVRAGPFESDAATSLAALALSAGAARERALDHVVSTQARSLPSDPIAPHDPDLPGWGWAVGTAGWTEPTARALLALRKLRPDAATAISGAVGFLIDRESTQGGWNFGNRFVYDVALPPFGQPTAVALIGLQGMAVAASGGDLVARGVGALRRLWTLERGPLTLATSLAAFRLLGLQDANEVQGALGPAMEGWDPDVISLAWIALASGPHLAELAVAA